ncbi:MAG: glutaredoxin 3 [Kordiimonas sp.]|nr:glutaredoxin 3 [Kordiimonas sp.]|tara:strand:+ start:4364 stop:4624 length:261 start_codon:yes stop_codon:yes gene_type:complete
MMPDITIYTKPLCPFCSRAKNLLSAKGAPFTEIDITTAPDQRPVMIERAGGRSTVPQIFIDQRHVGGCDDLFALEEQGELNTLLTK